MELEAEFTSEPFRGEGDPPRHAVRAHEIAAGAGLRSEFGPLGTTVHGEADLLLEALPSIIRGALEAGASRFTLQLRRDED